MLLLALVGHKRSDPIVIQVQEVVEHSLIVRPKAFLAVKEILEKRAWGVLLLLDKPHRIHDSEVVFAVVNDGKMASV